MTAPSGLGRRMAGALAFSFLGQGGQVVFQTLFFVLLARMLAPEAFGLVAAALVVGNVALHLATGGLRIAVVQLPHLTDQHVRVAVTMQQVSALLVFGALAVSASSVAALFRMPDLTPVLQLIALAYFVRALTVGDGLLLRRLQVRRLTTIDLAAYAVGYGGLAVPLALSGAGVYALVGGHLGHAVLRTAGLWVASRQPVAWELSRPHALELLRVGFGSALSQLIDLLAWEGDNFIVGRWLGASSLGVYERAYRLTIVPAGLLGLGMWQVLFPVLSEVQDESDRQRRIFGVASAVVAVLALPATVVLVSVAGDIVRVLLGQQWLDMVPVLAILLGTVFFRASIFITDSLVLATGKVYRLAARRAVFATLVIAGALVGKEWGVTGVAVGILVALGLSYLIMVDLALSLAGMPRTEYARAQVPGLVLSTVVAIAVLPVVALLHAAAAPSLVVLVAAPATAVAAALLFTMTSGGWRPVRSYFELLEQLAGVLGNRRVSAFVDRVVPVPATGSVR